MLLFFLLVGSALAQTDDSYDCVEDEFLANGYSTGQNIDMNYENSALSTDSGSTFLRVAFYVPKRYTEEYEANSFAITFNRDHTYTDGAVVDFENALAGGQTSEQVTGGVEQGSSDDSACYTNRPSNNTQCSYMDWAEEDQTWSISTNSDNACISDAEVTVPWADVMGDAFYGRTVRENGDYTEVFLTATVETWTHFNEGNASNYVGVMTGSEQWLNTDSDDNAINRQGSYGGDGGWRGVGADAENEEFAGTIGYAGDFGNIIMDDERYTLYQIPFILRFPRRVIVETSFKVASDITVLTGVIAQDVITLDMNPSGGNFAVLEAVLTTQIQYPYAVRSPQDPVAPMTVVTGSDYNGGDDHGSAEFVEYDEESSCGGVVAGELCTQTFKIRITPDANPCSVAGQYTFEFWAECIAGHEGGINGCTLDDKYTVDTDIETQRASNAYLSETININHQDFCPELLDEVRVVGDFKVYHDEAFTMPINDGQTTVYSNDQLYYEASYRTASAESLSGDFSDFEDNSSTEIGNDSIIDYVRATKIFMDVTLGTDSEGNPDSGWNADDWDSNMQFDPLGGSRIPGAGNDITGADLTVTTGSGSTAVYQIELCKVDAKSAAVIDFSADKADDCFTSKNDIATDFLDFTKVTMSKSNLNGDDNEIDENEIAFEMRMDERIIPLKPTASDSSFIKVTIESEVYYKGNRHPTRRLLQAGPTAGQSQAHSMTTAYRVYADRGLKTCTVGDDMKEGHLELDLTFNDADSIPSASGSLDWASRFSLQLESYLQVRDSVSVSRMEQCNEKACQTIYYEGRRTNRRRLEGKATYLKVDLMIASTAQASAGQTLNSLQNHVVNRRSDIHLRVSALVNAEVSSMEVPGCGDEAEFHKPRQTVGDDFDSVFAAEEEESSAAAVSTLLASLVALWGLRL